MTLTRLESEARPGGELVGSQNDLHAVACAVSTEGEDTAAIVIANLHAGRQRVVDAKAKALANGEPWLE